MRGAEVRVTRGEGRFFRKNRKSEGSKHKHRANVANFQSPFGLLTAEGPKPNSNPRPPRFTINFKRRICLQYVGGRASPLAAALETNYFALSPSAVPPGACGATLNTARVFCTVVYNVIAWRDPRASRPSALNFHSILGMVLKSCEYPIFSANDLL